MGRGYYISKQNNNNGIVYLDYDQISGYDIKPKNSDKYGIVINKMIIVKPSMIEKLLVKKTKAKLESFLKKIYLLLESDDSDGDAYREALNDMSRYRNIINYKYRKYLDDKFIEKMNKRIALLEKEIKRKQATIDNNNHLRMQQMYQNMYQNMYNNMYGSYEEERTTRRSR